MNYKSKINILGIDPGLQCTGWAIVGGSSHAFICKAAGYIQTRSETKLEDRLLHIFQSLQKVICDFEPNHAAIEETYANKNLSNSLHLAHARAAAMLAVSSAKLSLTHYFATHIKKSVTGSGSADKNQVKKLLQLRVQNIDEINKHDAMDAVAVALCHILNMR